MIILQSLLLVFATVATARTPKPVCGVRGRTNPSGGTLRIVGGTDAMPLEFPWLVSLRLSTTPNVVSTHFCGGSIINEKYVITAAHCIFPQFPSPDDYVVIVGEFNLTGKDPNEGRFPVKNITIHPLYNFTTLNYDYALLELKTPLDFKGSEKALMPICLPARNQGFDGQTCTAAGWGYTRDESESGASLSPSLRKVDLPIIRYTVCKRYYKTVRPVRRNTMICAGPKEGGKSTCEGDSGGPLQCARKDGRYVLAGSTSWGETCGAPREPSVFARTSTQLDWIRKIAGVTP
ncbi:unnamed protein product [Ixodes hexagonus]